MSLTTKVLSAVQLLLTRREQERRWIFLIATLPFLMAGLMGREYGALVPYTILAVVCVIQCFYPTLLGWAMIVFLYLLGSVAFMARLINDIVKISRGSKPQILGSGVDSVVFLVLTCLFVLISVGLVRWRPSKHNKEKTEGSGLNK